MRNVRGEVARVAARSGPLAGTLVLDLGQTAVGPVSAMFLGYLGATVLKIEPPRGELGRFDISRKHEAGFTFLSTNLGKYGIVLDFKDALDYSYMLALVGRADVVIDNFRNPEVMARLGLEYFDVLKELNPALVYLQSSSFQGRGPLHDLTSFEWVAQALSGFAGATGVPGGLPEFSRGTAYLDWTGAMINTIAVLAGLHRRRTTGEGSMLSTSQFGTSVFAGTSRLAGYLVAPDAAPRLGHDFGQDMLDRAFATRDGHLAICAPTAAVWRRLVEAAGLPPDTPEDPTGADLEPRIKAGTTDDWLERLRRARVPAGPLRAAPSLVDALRCEPQVVAEQLVVEHDPRRGGVLYPDAPWEVVVASANPPRPAPELGEDDELVKSVIDPARSMPSSQRATRCPAYTLNPLSRARPLAGFKVIEVGTGLAVGTAGMVLAELGATVTKVLPPWGDSAVSPNGAQASVLEDHLHAAKTVEQLDLASPDHRDRLDHLVQQAAAVIVAGPMRFRHAFALDDSDIRGGRSDIVYCGLTGFGWRGPLADAPATEFDVQLIAGMTRQLGRSGAPPVRQGFHLVSVNTGYAAAQAVMAGLLMADPANPADPADTGCGPHFEVSLLRTAVVLNGWNLTAESGHDGIAGKQVQATDWPPDHGYTCEDRQVLISIRNNDEGWMKFLTALDRVDLLADERFNTLEHLRANEWQLPGLLAETTALRTSEELELIVKECGGQLVPVLEPAEVLDHPQVAVQRLVRPRDGRFELPIDIVSRA